MCETHDPRIGENPGAVLLAKLIQDSQTPSLTPKHSLKDHRKESEDWQKTMSNKTAADLFLSKDEHPYQSRTQTRTLKDKLSICPL
jgi:hypothetical protein